MQTASICLSIDFFKFTHLYRHKYIYLQMSSEHTSWALLCPATLLLSPRALGWPCFLSLSSSPSVFFLQDLTIIILEGKNKKATKPHLQAALKDLKDALRSGRRFFFLIISALKCKYFLEPLLRCRYLKQ